MITARAPNPHQTPYHPFEETECYQAFREGWAARRAGKLCSDSPYALSQPQKALAWLDGWTAGERETADASESVRRPAAVSGA